MKIKRSSLALAVLAMITVGIAALARADSPAPPAPPISPPSTVIRWEYLKAKVSLGGEFAAHIPNLEANDPDIVVWNGVPTTRTFNDLGKEGWELTLEDHNNRYYFKRPKR